MSEPEKPVDLIDLLRTLERSRDLRALARECGLTVKELRRRLGSWRREIVAETNSEGRSDRSAPGRSRSGRAKKDQWPELTPAAELATSPLPRRGPQLLEIWTDGASKGNPGPAAIGILFTQQGGEALCSHQEAIGRATNNVAEYTAVVRALEFCRDWRIKRVNLHLDSELVARQLSGAYRVKSPDLRPLYQQVVFLTRALKDFQVRHVPRSENAHADHLANQALIPHKRGRRPRS